MKSRMRSDGFDAARARSRSLGGGGDTHRWPAAASPASEDTLTVVSIRSTLLEALRLRLPPDVQPSPKQARLQLPPPLPCVSVLGRLAASQQQAIAFALLRIASS